MEIVRSILSFFAGFFLYKVGRWMYFRIREWEIRNHFDGTTFWTVIKENLRRD